MSNGEEKSKGDDFYAVLGLNKECNETELRHAYKKLALRWHPDRCSGGGNPVFVEEAKKKFQNIQQAYSVLSDANKRFLYDVGAYDYDDDDNNVGMGDFLNEMAGMMSKTKVNAEESFEDLQDLFHEMFQKDIEAFGSSYQSTVPSSSSSYASSCESSNLNNKRNSSQMSSEMRNLDDAYEIDAHYENFSLGTGKTFQKGGEGKKRNSKRSQ